jgi:4-amino-4-deoxy-L-arabinose transferase-like glycosyltransferase
LAAASAAAPAAGLDAADGAALSGLFFLLLLSFAAYLIASDWWGLSAGLSAACLVSFLPPLLSASRHPQTDLALAAWTAAAYACWNFSRGFTLWGWSLGLGAVGAAGLLTRGAFLIYAAPILVLAARDLVKPRERGARWKYGPRPPSPSQRPRRGTWPTAWNFSSARRAPRIPTTWC